MCIRGWVHTFLSFQKMMTLFSSPSYTTVPRNGGYPFATDIMRSFVGCTVYLPVPFCLIVVSALLPCNFSLLTIGCLLQQDPTPPNPPQGPKRVSLYNSFTFSFLLLSYDENIPYIRSFLPSVLRTTGYSAQYRTSTFPLVLC
jgi:hypothetical protein